MRIFEFSGEILTKPAPIALLQTIEAIARLGSLKAAANELNITPSAVSHRVRSVEAMLGQLLFIRVGQGVRPNENARALADVVARANRDISDAWQRLVEGDSNRPIRISCPSAFAEQYIFPDIKSFKAKFPEFELKVTTSHRLGQDLNQHVDLAIVLDPNLDPDWVTTQILEFTVRPIIAIDSAQDPIRDGKLFGPLLSYSSSVTTWPLAAAAMGLEIHPEAQQISTDSVHSASAAAEQGVGLALLPFWIAERLIKTGKVICLAEQRISLDTSYWLAMRRDQRNFPRLERFKRWLIAQTERHA